MMIISSDAIVCALLAGARNAASFARVQMMQ
jgi:hypothetical protein